MKIGLCSGSLKEELTKKEFVEFCSAKGINRIEITTKTIVDIQQLMEEVHPGMMAGFSFKSLHFPFGEYDVGEAAEMIVEVQEKFHFDNITIHPLDYRKMEKAIEMNELFSIENLGPREDQEDRILTSIFQENQKVGFVLDTTHAMRHAHRHPLELHKKYGKRLRLVHFSTPEHRPFGTATAEDQEMLRELIKEIEMTPLLLETRGVPIEEVMNDLNILRDMASSWNIIYKDQGENYKYYGIFDAHEDMPAVAEEFRKVGVKRVLDLGCGAGRNLLFLAKAGFDVVGLDAAPEGLKLLRQKLTEQRLSAELRKGSFFEPLPYPDSSFDAIISVQSLQHGREEDIKKAIKEIERVLRPGGLFFVTLCGRTSKGKVRLFLVKTATKIAPHTYVPTQGDEKGLTHFIYTKELLKDHFKAFTALRQWRDGKDYYCLLCRKRESTTRR
jgi:ubiquinone/menaquinone biosynthesis C-methylase UbiE